MLTDSQIRKAKYNLEKGRMKLFDIDGLYLEVKKNGRKVWYVRTWKDKKEKVMSIGEYPVMSLSEARAAAKDFKIRFRSGLPEEKTLRTFGELAREWVDVKMRPVRVAAHVESIEQRLTLHILPYIGDIAVEELTPAAVLPVLRRIEKQGKTETAYRVSNIISQVLRYGVALSEVQHDFMPDLRGALQAKRTGRHFAALTEPKDIAAFLIACRDAHGPITLNGIFFNVYTFVRPNELRHAEWREFDIENALWTIPAEKMKMRREHTVPLSRQALSILETMKEYTGKSDYVFPQSRDFKKPMSECTILVEIKKALKRAGLSEKAMTWHGFRAMASTQLNAQGWDIDAIERQLAHSTDRIVRFAYNRHEYMDTRRRMMQAWADWIDGLVKE